jgi:ribosomal protein L40E
MNKNDWLEYFEAVNDRMPTDEEIEQALVSGEFKEDKPSEAEFVVSSESTMNFSEPAVSQGLKQTKFCRNCGAELDIHAKFCTSCGAVQDEDSQNYTEVASKAVQTSAFSANVKSYFASVFNSLRHPVTFDVEEMSPSYGWITFGIIWFIEALSMALLSSSIGVFFVWAIFGFGLNMLVVLLWQGLGNGILKLRLKFNDMFKITAHVMTVFLPIVLLNFVIAVIGWLIFLGQMNTASSLAQSGTNSLMNGSTTGAYNNYMGAGGSFLSGLGTLMIFYVIIYIILLAGLFLNVMLFGIYFYKQALKSPNSKIDRLPWFVLALVAIGVVIVLIMFFIIAAIISAMLVNTFNSYHP